MITQFLLQGGYAIRIRVMPGQTQETEMGIGGCGTGISIHSAAGKNPAA